MLAFFLALVFLNDGKALHPEFMQGYRTRDECLLSAMKLNAAPVSQTPAAKKLGAVFICLSVVDASY